MEKIKVLYITQEMKPYLQLSEIANIARNLPQKAQEQKMEIRVLMPRFGVINERRHRLHEVVRLSGINIIIDEDDYPLIIKVASLPGARMQVYFLDNEDFFKRKAVFGDKKEKFYEDNPERMIFFCKGVIETVKKFGWPPDIVHCHGWMTSLVPLYLKTAYKNEPVFSDSKVIYSVYSKYFEESLSDNFLNKAPLIKKSIDKSELEHYAEANNIGLDKGAVSHSDAVIIGNEKAEQSVQELARTIKKPVLELKGEEEDYLDQILKFYEEVLDQK